MPAAISIRIHDGHPLRDLASALPELLEAALCDPTIVRALAYFAGRSGKDAIVSKLFDASQELGVPINNDAVRNLWTDAALQAKEVEPFAGMTLRISKSGEVEIESGAPLTIKGDLQVEGELQAGPHTIVSEMAQPMPFQPSNAEDKMNAPFGSLWSFSEGALRLNRVGSEGNYSHTFGPGHVFKLVDVNKLRGESSYAIQADLLSQAGSVERLAKIIKKEQDAAAQKTKDPIKVATIRQTVAGAGLFVHGILVNLCHPGAGDSIMMFEAAARQVNEAAGSKAC